MSLAELLSETVEKLKRRPASESNPYADALDVANAPPDTRRMIRNRQYCQIISKNSKTPFDDVSIACAERFGTGDGAGSRR